MAKKSSETEYLKQHDRQRLNINQTIPVKRGGKLEKGHTLWATFVLVLSFTLSIVILLISTSIFAKVAAQWAFVVVVIIIGTGIIFDVIGVAVTAADEIPFHSMASRKMHGARQSIMLIRNASRVSSICNDVVGDICGVVSGTAGAAIVYRLFSGASDTAWIEIIAGAIIASMTVGGKAFAKNFGINNSDYIVYYVGRILAFFSRTKKRA